MSGEELRYSYRVEWSEEDQEYVGQCAEFPSVSWLEPDMDQAYSGIRRVIGEIVMDMRSNGEAVPEPIALRQCSGRLLVRVPPATHRRLAREAMESKVSLNRLINEKLSM